MKQNKNTIVAVFVIAALIQAIIITYNYVTGYIQIPTPLNFLTRLIIGTSFSFVFGLILVFLDKLIINQLDKILILPSKVITRIPIEYFFAVIAGTIVGSTVTMLSHLLMPYADGLIKNVINNSLIISVINIIIITAIEAVSWFNRSQKSQLKSEQLEKENALIKFETLKSQLNPHFLFNSLNALSSLIKKDSIKAQNFVDEFSSVYRYTLDVIEKPVVELSEELEFAKSYLYLQNIRFENAVCIDINVDASRLNYFVPPLAVQTLLENIFKHNKISSESPLKIKLYNDDDALLIVNNLQPKIKAGDSKGVGLNNLKKRYELLGFNEAQFSITNNEYVAKIPLIKND